MTTTPKHSQIERLQPPHQGHPQSKANRAAPTTSLTAGSTMVVEVYLGLAKAPIQPATRTTHHPPNSEQKNARTGRAAIFVSEVPPNSCAVRGFGGPNPPKPPVQTTELGLPVDLRSTLTKKQGELVQETTLPEKPLKFGCLRSLSIASFFGERACSLSAKVSLC